VKTGAPVREIDNVIIWGNHSAKQYPDIAHARIEGKPAAGVVGDEAWVRDTFVPMVAKRGAAIIEARGASSAASAANAAMEHVHDWMTGTPDGIWTSVALHSTGQYGVEEGLFSSFPAVSKDGVWEVVEGLEIDEYAQGKIDESVAELAEERDAVKALGLI
jgi:malate dehydrogenase